MFDTPDSTNNTDREQIRADVRLAEREGDCSFIIRPSYNSSAQCVSNTNNLQHMCIMCVDIILYKLCYSTHVFPSSCSMFSSTYLVLSFTNHELVDEEFCCKSKNEGFNIVFPCSSLLCRVRTRQLPTHTHRHTHLLPLQLYSI